MKILNKIKNNSKGFAHLELIVIVVVVAVIAGAGYFVYQHHKKATVSHASGYSSLFSAFGFNINACQNYSSAFNGTYTVKVYFIQPASITGGLRWTSYQLNTFRGPTREFHYSGAAFFNGVVGSLTIYASKPKHDLVEALAKNGNGAFFGPSRVDPASIQTCPPPSVTYL